MAYNKMLIVLLGFFVLLTLAQFSSGVSVLQKRHISEGEEDEAKPKVLCENDSPCGWAVYTPFTRNVEFFMSNTCVCEPTKKCVRTDDDYAVSAFVYRCRDVKNKKPPSSDTSSTPNSA